MEYDGADMLAGLTVLNDHLRLANIDLCCVDLGSTVVDTVPRILPVVALDLDRTRDGLCMMWLWRVGRVYRVVETEA